MHSNHQVLRVEESDYNDLLAILCGGFEPGVEQRGSALIVERQLYATALEMGFDPDPRVAFRASWALEKAYFADPHAFAPLTNYFVECFIRTNNSSAHRHYSKMLCDMMRRNLVCLEGQRAEAVAERCFDFLISPKVKVAVKVWAMEVLYDLRKMIPWVGNELRETLYRLQDGATPAFIAHSRRLLRRMQSENAKIIKGCPE